MRSCVPLSSVLLLTLGCAGGPATDSIEQAKKLPYSASRFQVTLDGSISPGYIRKIEGGDLRLGAALRRGDGLFEWASAALDGRGGAHDVRLAALGPKDEPVWAIELPGATLAAVAFPDFDRSDDATAYTTLTLAAKTSLPPDLGSWEVAEDPIIPTVLEVSNLKVTISCSLSISPDRVQGVRGIALGIGTSPSGPRFVLVTSEAAPWEQLLAKGERFSGRIEPVREPFDAGSITLAGLRVLSVTRDAVAGWAVALAFDSVALR